MSYRFTRALCSLAAVVLFAWTAAAADLTMWGIQTFSKRTDQLIEDTLQAFAKSRGITAEYVVIPANYLNERLAAALEGGNPPDIFMNIGEQVQYFMSMGVTASVDDVFQELNERSVLPIIHDMLKYDGVAQALPVEVDITPIFVCTDWLREVGVAMPTTMEELRQACILMKQKRLVQYPMGFSLSPCNDAEAILRCLIWSFGGALFSEDGKTITFDSPEVRACMDFLNTAFREDRIISRSSLTWDDSGNNTAYQTGTAAFVANTPSIYSWLYENDREKLANTALIPFPKGNTPTSRSGNQITAQCLMVSNKSPNVDLAKDFLRWFYRDDNYRALINSCGGRWLPIFPSMLDDMPLFTDTPHFEHFRTMVDSGIMNGYRSVSTAASAEIAFARIVSSVVAKVLDDSLPVAEATAWGQQEMEKILAKSK